LSLASYVWKLVLLTNHRLSYYILLHIEHLEKVFPIKSYHAACSVFDAIYNRKIKFLTKLQFSDNILFIIIFQQKNWPISLVCCCYALKCSMLYALIVS